LVPTEKPIALRGPSNHRKGPQELAAIGIKEPFFKRQRRERREFTVQEDEALLKGFEKYQAQWKKIRADPELGLQSRSRTDLRDRFRNRYPGKFIEAGYKFRNKDVSGASKDDVGGVDNVSSSNKGQENYARPSADEPDAASSSISALLDPPPSASMDRGTHSLKLLTASISDPHLMDYDALTPDDDPATITLSRNIFAWADQNSNTVFRNVSSGQNEPSKTLSRQDQFYINPLVATKMSSKQSVPISGILNGPGDVSLPGPSDLISGLDAEGKVAGSTGG
jgi:Myb-like DNA-binding domain